MLAASASFVASCTLIMEKDDDIPVEPAEDHEAFQIRFQICTRTLGSTREADIKGDEEGSEAENIINLDDIRYYIFDKDQKFLLDLTPDIDKNRSMEISTDYSLYEVVAKIDQEKTPYFKENKNGTIDFYILAFANYSSKSGYGSYDGNLQYLNGGTGINNLSDMFASPGSPVINSLPNTQKLMNANNPNYSGRSYFPMAGLQHFTLNGSWFETYTGNSAIDLSSITGKNLNMLRALAKIEVIDRINIEPEGKFDSEKDSKKIRIKGVSIDGVMKNARLLPDINQWKRLATFETQQVVGPSIPESYHYLLPPVLAANGSISEDQNLETPYGIKFEYDAIETLKRDDHCPVYSSYVWEYSRKDNMPESQLPYLSVSVGNPEEIDHDAKLQDVTIPASTTYHVRLLADMTPDATTKIPQASILRNHIYRYEIGAAGTGISIKWSVCPMDEASADITFN